MAKELKLTQDIIKSADSEELIRVWELFDKQKFIINTLHYSDPAMWGILIVDLMKQVTSSYCVKSDLEYEQVFERIMQGFKVELNNPSG